MAKDNDGDEAKQTKDDKQESQGEWGTNTSGSSADY